MLHQANIAPGAVCNGPASVLGEFAARAVLAPAETLKQRRKITVPNTRESTGASMCALASSAQLHALRRGCVALVTRNVPVTALHFPLYERFRAALNVRWRD